MRPSGEAPPPTCSPSAMCAASLFLPLAKEGRLFAIVLRHQVLMCSMAQADSAQSCSAHAWMLVSLRVHWIAVHAWLFMPKGVGMRISSSTHSTGLWKLRAREPFTYLCCLGSSHRSWVLKQQRGIDGRCSTCLCIAMPTITDICIDLQEASRASRTLMRLGAALLEMGQAAAVLSQAATGHAVPVIYGSTGFVHPDGQVCIPCAHHSHCELCSWQACMGLLVPKPQRVFMMLLVRRSHIHKNEGTNEFYCRVFRWSQAVLPHIMVWQKHCRLCKCQSGGRILLACNSSAGNLTSKGLCPESFQRGCVLRPPAGSNGACAAWRGSCTFQRQPDDRLPPSGQCHTRRWPACGKGHRQG